jgi:hypothetical protein
VNNITAANVRRPGSQASKRENRAIMALFLMPCMCLMAHPEVSVLYAFLASSPLFISARSYQIQFFK